jgi:hypothetical protein
MAVLAALGAMAIAHTLQCGSDQPVGFAPASPSPGTETPDAGAGKPYPSFGSSSSTTWSQTFGGTAVTPYAVAAAADGTEYLSGTLDTLATVGAVTLRSAGGTDVVLARLGPGGAVLWARNYGDAQNQGASVASVASDGNLLLGGTFAGTLDLANGNSSVVVVENIASSQLPNASPLHARGTADAFVAKLAPDSTLLWASQLGGVGAAAEAAAMAPASDGTTLVAGAFTGTVDFDAIQATSAGETDAFVASLDGAGHARWVKTFGGRGDDAATSIAVDTHGDILATGTYEGSIEMGGGALAAFGGKDVFVVRLDASGNTLWAKGFGGPIDDDAVAVAFDPQENAITLGNYSGNVNLGTGTITNFGAQGWDVFVAKYASDGAAQWAQHYGSMDDVDRGDALAVDGDGNIYVAGHVRSPFTFGHCVVTPANAEFGDAFVGWITTMGNAQCAAEYGYGATTHVRAMTLHPAGGLALAGDYIGGVNFGQGSMVSTQDSGFVAREDLGPVLATQ